VLLGGAAAGGEEHTLHTLHTQDATTCRHAAGVELARRACGGTRRARPLTFHPRRFEDEDEDGRYG
jgi:hypothetical protein